MRKTFGRRLVDKSGFNQRLKEAVTFAGLPEDLAKHSAAATSPGTPRWLLTASDRP